MTTLFKLHITVWFCHENDMNKADTGSSLTAVLQGHTVVVSGVQYRRAIHTEQDDEKSCPRCSVF